MAFDFKKEYKEFYMPQNKPAIIEIPKMNFVAVKGKGDPNTEDGEYKKALNILYKISYTLKMSYKTDYKINGFFEYVVPPLEGFWWQDDFEHNINYSDKEGFFWISLIRLPDFITKEDFLWAINKASDKIDPSFAEFMTYDEGLCVQCMHIGSYDNEVETISAMTEFAKENGFKIDITDRRFHHEIYLSDPSKVEASKLKTVIRLPVKSSKLKIEKL